MKNHIFLIGIIILTLSTRLRQSKVQISNSANNQCRLRVNANQIKKPFNAIFSAIWFGGYCFNTTSDNGTCNQAQINKWDRQSFTIHGLWPQARTQRQYEPFNIAYINQNYLLYSKMRKHWLTPWNSDNQEKYWVWDHEYNKHGIIYSNILQLLNPQKYRNASDKILQQTYFKHTLKFYHLFNLQMINLNKNHKEQYNRMLTKKRLSQIIGLDQQYFVLKCKNSHILRAVKICLQIQKNLAFTLKKCSVIDEAGETKNPLKDNCLENKAMLFGYAFKI